MNHSPHAETALQAELFGFVQDMRVFLALEGAGVDALWILDRDDPSRGWVSPRFWGILGYRVEEGAGSTAAPLPPPTWREVAEADDLRAFEEAIARSAEMAEPEPVSRVIRFRHTNGYALSTQVSGLPCSSRLGGPKDRIVGFHKDLNYTIQLERLLDEVNEMARIGAWSWNVISGELHWSRMVYEIHEVDDLSYVPDIATAINFYREGWSREKIAQVVTECLESGKSWDVVLEVVTAKGNVRWVRAVGHGEIWQVLGLPPPSDH